MNIPNIVPDKTAYAEEGPVLYGGCPVFTSRELCYQSDPRWTLGVVLFAAGSYHFPNLS